MTLVGENVTEAMENNENQNQEAAVTATESVTEPDVAIEESADTAVEETAETEADSTDVDDQASAAENSDNADVANDMQTGSESAVSLTEDELRDLSQAMMSCNSGNSEKKNASKKQKQNKKAKSGSNPVVLTSGGPLKLHWGVGMDHVYHESNPATTLIMGSDGNAIKAILNNLIGQLVMQYDEKSVEVRVWGENDDWWFNQEGRRAGLNSCNIVKQVMSSNVVSYSNLLRNIMNAQDERKGMFAEKNVRDAANYRMVTGEDISNVVVYIAAGVPTNVYEDEQATFNTMVKSISENAKASGVYLISSAEFRHKVLADEAASYESVVCVATDAEQSVLVFGDDRAGKMKNSDFGAWIKSIEESGVFFTEYVTIPDYAPKKIQEICNGLIHPNKCSFPKWSLQELAKLYKF